MSSVNDQNANSKGSSKNKILSLGSAAMLTVLTLAVFSYSADSGPASTVRRYHLALLEDDLEELKAITVSTSDRDSAVLKQYITDLLRQSESIQLGKVQKDGRIAYVDVTYALPRSGNISAVRFVVRKPNHRWRIHSQDTLKTLFRMMEY